MLYVSLSILRTHKSISGAWNKKKKPQTPINSNFASRGSLKKKNQQNVFIINIKDGHEDVNISFTKKDKECAKGGRAKRMDKHHYTHLSIWLIDFYNF